MTGFDAVLGNELVKTQLASAIENDRVAHAYIFSGEKGMGKKTLANAFAEELFCTEKDSAGRACGHCPSCKKVLSHNHPDVIYVTHEKPLTISVDDVREQITDTAGIRPYSGGHKLYIVPDAELMSVQAQNALLKTLEEPPGYVVILLLASDDKKLLDTVRSRSFRETLRPLTDSAVRQYMQEHFNAAGEKAGVCVAFAKGNLGKAIELWESETFSDWYQRIMKILRSIREMDSTAMRIEIAKLQSECPDLMEALDLIELWYRELTLFMVTRDLNGLAFTGERKTLMEAASRSSCPGVQYIMERIETCRKRLKANVNPELSLELLFLSMKEN